MTIGIKKFTNTTTKHTEVTHNDKSNNNRGATRKKRIESD